MVVYNTYMDHASINQNNTALLKYYNWNSLLAVGKKLLFYKNNNYIHVGQVYNSKPARFQLM